MIGKFLSNTKIPLSLRVLTFVMADLSVMFLTLWTTITILQIAYDTSHAAVIAACVMLIVLTVAVFAAGIVGGVLTVLAMLDDN